MTEPTQSFQIQSGNRDEVEQWYGSRRLEFYSGRAKGGVLRFAVHPDDPTIHLCEWWDQDQDELPEPKFLMTA